MLDRRRCGNRWFSVVRVSIRHLAAIRSPRRWCHPNPEVYWSVQILPSRYKSPCPRFNSLSTSPHNFRAVSEVKNGLLSSRINDRTALKGLARSRASATRRSKTAFDGGPPTKLTRSFTVRKSGKLRARRANASAHCVSTLPLPGLIGLMSRMMVSSRHRMRPWMRTLSGSRNLSTSCVGQH